MKITKTALIQSYSQSMGIEAAKDLVTKKIKSASLAEKELYTKEETSRIFGELVKEGGLINTVAQNLVAQFERKRSKEQTLLLDNVENQIWYLTDKETYGTVNKAHADFLGLKKEYLEGRDLCDTLSAKEADVCVANNREVFENKKQSHREEWIKNGRGKTCLLSITRTPKIDDNGNVEYVICAAEDITERKKAEEKIKEADMIINKSPAVAFTWKNEEGWPVEYVSENVKKLFGYSTEDFLSRKIIYADCIYPDDLERVEQEVEDFSEERESEEFVHEAYRILTKDNDVKVVKDWTLIVRDFEGNITHYKGIIEDITERKQAEESLRESELRYRSLTDDVLDTSSVGIFILDSNFQVVWVNHALERYFGLRREEVIGKDKRQLILERIKDIFEDPVYFAEKVFATYDDNTYIEHFECHIVPDSEREERWLEHWSQPILSGLYAGGRVEHYSDITERKQVDEALRKSDALLIETGRMAKMGGWEVDAKTLEVIWTEEIYRIHEVPLDQKPPLQEAINFYHPDDRPKLETAIQKALEHGEPYDLEIRFITAKGKHLWTHTICKPIIVDGNTVKLTGTFQDITERKQAEEELQKRMNELETFYRATLGREERVIELKREVNELSEVE